MNNDDDESAKGLRMDSNPVEESKIEELEDQDGDDEAGGMMDQD